MEEFDQDELEELIQRLKNSDIAGLATITQRGDEKLVISCILKDFFFGGMVLQILAWEDSIHNDALKYSWFFMMTDGTDNDLFDITDAKTVAKVLN